MMSSVKDQNQITLISSRIRHYTHRIDPCLDHQNKFRSLLRMLVSDRLMQPIFKRMIRQELYLVPQQQSQTAGADADATKTIRQRVKKRLVGLVRKEWSKAIKQKISGQTTTLQKDELRSEKRIQIIEIDDDQIKPETNPAEQTTEKSDLYPNAKRAILGKYLSYAPKAKLSLTSPFDKTYQFGHFQYGDKFCRIIDHQINGSEEQLNVLIQWQPRKDGSTPVPSMLSFSQFSYFRPLEAKLFQEQVRVKQ